MLGDGEAEGLGRLEVDDEVEGVGCSMGRSAGLRALEDLVHVAAARRCRSSTFAAYAMRPPSWTARLVGVHGWQPTAGRQAHDLCASCSAAERRGANSASACSALAAANAASRSAGSRMSSISNSSPSACAAACSSSRPTICRGARHPRGQRLAAGLAPPAPSSSSCLPPNGPLRVAQPGEVPARLAPGWRPGPAHGIGRPREHNGDRSSWRPSPRRWPDYPW